LIKTRDLPAFCRVLGCKSRPLAAAARLTI
jgi:hypothetical protein